MEMPFELQSDIWVWPSYCRPRIGTDSGQCVRFEVNGAGSRRYRLACRRRMFRRNAARHRRPVRPALDLPALDLVDTHGPRSHRQSSSIARAGAAKVVTNFLGMASSD